MASNTPLVVNDTSVKTSQALWQRAYEKLDSKDKNTLAKHGFDSASYQTALLIMNERDDAAKSKNPFILEVAGKTFKLRVLANKIIALLDKSRDCVGAVASLEPHAALAYIAMSVILLPLIRQQTQDDDMCSGLEHVAFLLRIYRLWEPRYLTDIGGDFQISIIELYKAILHYQAKVLDHLFRNAMLQGARNVLGNNWASWLEDIKKHDEECQRFSSLADIRLERRAWELIFHNEEVESRFRGDVERSLKTIRDAFLGRKGAETEETLKKITKCLSNNYKGQKKAIDERVSGTCEWFLQHEAFQRWLDKKESCVLHVHAGPGCGKSVLAKFLVDDRLVARAPDVPILYFFFNDRRGGLTRCAQAIAAILHQLFCDERYRGMAGHAVAKFDEHGSKLSNMFEELWEILQCIVKDDASSEIVCVIDALDECRKDDRQKLANALIDLSKTAASTKGSKGGILKVLITSRPYGEINIILRPLREKQALIDLDGSEHTTQIQAEIKHFLQFKVDELLPERKELQDALLQGLMEHDNRTYLWVYLILDFIKENLSGSKTKRDLAELLRKLPKQLEDVYKSILERSTDYRKAGHLFKIVLGARRPLSISELNIALRLSLGTFGDPASYRALVEDEIESESEFRISLRDLCGLMLNVVDGHVILVHKTARDYLMSAKFKLKKNSESLQGPIRLPDCDHLMALVCIQYLRLSDIGMNLPWTFKQWDNVASKKEEVTFMNKHALFHYACTCWILHYKDVEKQACGNNLHQHVKALCDVGSNGFFTWYKVLTLHRGPPERRIPLGRFPFPDHYGATSAQNLWYASHLGLELLVKDLLVVDVDLERENYIYGTALQAAAESGHESIIELLLKNGADVNGESNASKSAKKAIARCEYDSVLGLLMANDADVGVVRPRNTTTALRGAVRNGHISTARFLLDHGADTSENGPNHTMLIDSVQCQSEPMVRLLLDRGYRVNTQFNDYGSALYQAAKHRNQAVVLLLLEKGADVNLIEATYRQSPLHAAAGRGITENVKVLLDNEADVNSQDRHGRTPLREAIQAGSLDTARLLIDKGADVDQQDCHGETPLHEALEQGNVKILQMLVDSGAGLDRKNKQGRTPVCAAVVKGSLETVQILLNGGADVNGENDDGSTPLLMAMALSHRKPAVMQILLKAGAHVDEGDSSRITALYQAVRKNDLESVQILLDGRLVAYAQSAVKQFSLLQAAITRNLDMVRLLFERTVPIESKYFIGETTSMASLLDRRLAYLHNMLTNGFDVNARDTNGDTALMWSTRSDADYTIVQLLLDKGADLNAQDENGWTALMFAARGRNPTITGLLLSKVSDLEAQNEDGWTALMTAAKWGDKATVQLLLDKGSDLNVKDESGATALMHALRRRRLLAEPGLTQLLLNKEQDLDAKDGEGRTALFYALARRDLELVRLLLDKGSNLDAKDEKGRTALTYALECRDLELARLLIDKGSDLNAKDEKGRTALFYALKRRDLELVRLLLDKGSDLEAKDEEGMTALMHALNSLADPELVWLLLDKGSDPTVKDNYGRSVLMLASSEATALVELLLDKDTDIDTKDSRTGTTILMYAIGCGAGPTNIQLLLDKGVDPNVKDDEGCTALISAARYGPESDPAIMRLLLDKGADPNVKDDEGYTALLSAARYGPESDSAIISIKLLLDKGSDVKTCTERGETALMLASSWCEPSKRLVQLLLDEGSDLYARDENGRTALMIAMEKHASSAVIQLLLHGGPALSADVDHEWLSRIRREWHRHSDCFANIRPMFDKSV